MRVYSHIGGVQRAPYIGGVRKAEYRHQTIPPGTVPDETFEDLQQNAIETFELQGDPIIGQAEFRVVMGESWTITDPYDATKLIMYFTGWSDGTATISGVYRATASKASPNTWGDITCVLRIDDDDLPSALAYMRVGGGQYRNGLWMIYVSDGPTAGKPGAGAVWLITSHDGLNFTFRGENGETGSAADPILTRTGQGRDDGAKAAIGCIVADGGNLWMTYAINPSTNNAVYLLAQSFDGGFTFEKVLGIDPLFSATDMDGTDLEGIYLEYQSVTKFSDGFLLVFEGNAGAWKCYKAQSNSGDIRDGFGSPSLILDCSGDGGWAGLYVATPRLLRISGGIYLTHQGSPISSGGNIFEIGLAPMA